jgi:lysozyme family protein
MQSNKEKVFTFTYKEEGGYGNDPNDPGGATNLGIIQVEYNKYRDAKGLPQQSVRHITKAEADEIYTKSYWNKIDGDEIPMGIDLVIYDYGVNSGPGRSIEYAQRVLKVGVDGVLGPITIAALKAVEPKKFIHDFDNDRLSFLQRLKTYVYFGKGWSARVKRCTNAALAMVGEEPKHVETSIKEPKMLPEIILGIVRHVITGSGASLAGLNGFDTHNPSTWLGIAMFIGGAVMSGVDKTQKSGHFNLLSLVQNTLSAVNDKMDEAANSNKSA